MTTPNIGNKGSIPYGVNMENKGRDAVGKSEKGAVAFGAMLTQYNQPVSNEAQIKTQDSMVASIQTQKNDYTDSSMNKGNQSSISEVSGDPISDTIESAKEEIGEFEEEVISTISKDLGVEDEIVEEALMTLGLSVFDLMNPQNLGMLVMQISGAKDQMQLLTDPSFLNLMQDIGQLGGDLMNRLNLEMNQMNELIRQMDILEQEEPFEGFLQQQTEILNDMQNTAEESIIGEQNGMEQVLNSSDVAGNEDVADVADSAEMKGQSQVKEGNDFASQTKNQGNEMNFSEESGNANSGINDQTVLGSVHPTGTVFEQIMETVPIENAYVSVDTLDLISQITQNVRSAVMNGTTTLEMQLNPENLGRVSLNLTSQEGVVNAQFTVTSEQVRAALEAQLADLRNNLNQAGIKVDAIEVAVASHEFEQNLEQDGHHQEQAATQQASFGRNRRSLNQNSLDELSGLMTEEEQLAAQIMKDNGNSMDIMV